MNEISISQKIKQNYVDYAIEVNTYRSLPSVFDGLKVVQRRLLLTGAKIAQDKLTKSASIIGECMAKYHPHGDSSLYGTLVSLVNDSYPMFIGQGNWGDYETNAAAYRYTSAKLSDFSKSFYLPYLKYAPLVENELGYTENSYIPTKVPYALVNGTTGIGLGISTNIPSFTLKSVTKYVEWLNSPSGKSEPDLRLNYASCDMDSNVLVNGYGRVKYNVIYWQEDDKTFVIKDNIPGVNIKQSIYDLLKTEIEAKKVFIRDESSSRGLRLVVGKLWWINMQDIESRIKKVSRPITVSMNWSTGNTYPLVRRLAPRQVLEICLEKYLKAIEGWKTKELDKITTELKFQKIKSKIVKKLLKDMTWDQIQSELSLTSEMLNYAKNKTLNQLSKENFNETELHDKIVEIKSVSI